MYVLKDVNTIMEYVTGFNPGGQANARGNLQNAIKFETLTDIITLLRSQDAIAKEDQDPLKVVRVKGDRWVVDVDLV